MTKTLLLAGAAAVLLALPATAHASCSTKDATFKPTGNPSNLYAYEDCDSTSTKNLNGRVGQSAALAAAADTRITDPDERLNLDLNWAANEFGTGGAVGGGAFFHVPELADGLHIGLRGAHSTDGGGSVFGVGVSYAVSPF